MTDPERDCPKSLCESARFMPFASGTNKPPHGGSRTDGTGGFFIDQAGDQTVIDQGRNVEALKKANKGIQKGWLISDGGS